MKFTEYIKSLVSSNSKDSSKSFSLVLSSLVGGIIGLTIAACLLIDVIKNGYLKTNLYELGIFLLCVGGYMAGGGFNKAISERYKGRCEVKKDVTPPPIEK